MTASASAPFPQLLVDGLVRSIEESDLFKLFNKFGRVRHVGTVVGKRDQAIVTLWSKDAMERIMRVGKLSCRGRKLSVSVLGDHERVIPCEEHDQAEECMDRARTKNIQIAGKEGGNMKKDDPRKVNKRKDDLKRESLRRTSLGRDDVKISGVGRLTSRKDVIAVQQDTEYLPPSQGKAGPASYERGKTRPPSRPAPRHGNRDRSNYTGLPMTHCRTSPVKKGITKLHCRPVESSTPVYCRQFTSHDSIDTTLPSQPTWPGSPTFNMMYYSCSPFQPLPLVFPIYHMDNFYMSMTPLVPGYCIQPSTTRI